MEKDVIQVLVEDQAVLSWLSARLRIAQSAAARSLIFDEFVRALGAHQTVIDRTVIPAFKSFGWRGLTSDVLIGHMQLKRSLAELLTLRRDSPSFQRELDQLLDRLQFQSDVERDKLLPLLRDRLDAGQRAMLAYDAEAHLTRMLGDDGVQPDDVDVVLPASELVEEAQVVLASLPSRNERTPLAS